MALRKTPLITGFTYHVFNQGIDRRTTFTNKREYNRALQTFKFYLYNQHITKLSYYLSSGTNQLGLLQQVQQHPKLVAILAFCLMPNHFHFVLRQEVDGGISKFMADFQNSYTKYFNTKHTRKGSLFLNPFRALRVETDEQLLHLIRYVHLNPYTSGIISTTRELFTFPYSSLPYYFQETPPDQSIYTDMIHSFFTTTQKHQQFIQDQSGYQKTLAQIKHLTHEHEL